MREGSDVTLVSFGKMVGYNLKAAELLADDGISAEVCTSRDVHFVSNANDRSAS